MILQIKSKIQINDNIKIAIKYIIDSDSKKIYSFDIPNEDKKILEIIATLYFNQKFHAVLCLALNYHEC